MKEISNIFESLYTHFLLRDVAAKVLPGAISLGILLKLLYPDALILLIKLLVHSPLIGWVVVYGLGLMFGMLLQALAERSGAIVIHVWKNKAGKYDRIYSLGQAQKFIEKANDPRGWNLKRERLVIFKEMAGNYSITILFLILGLGVRLLEFPEARQTQFYIALVVLPIIYFALRWQNLYQADEQRDWEDLIISPPTTEQNADAETPSPDPDTPPA